MDDFRSQVSYCINKTAESQDEERRLLKQKADAAFRQKDTAMAEQLLKYCVAMEGGQRLRTNQLRLGTRFGPQYTMADDSISAPSTSVENPAKRPRTSTDIQDEDRPRAAGFPFFREPTSYEIAKLQDLLTDIPIHRHNLPPTVTLGVPELKFNKFHYGGSDKGSYMRPEPSLSIFWPASGNRLAHIVYSWEKGGFSGSTFKFSNQSSCRIIPKAITIDVDTEKITMG